MKKKKSIYKLLIIAVLAFVVSSLHIPDYQVNPLEDEDASRWVDSIMKDLSLEHQIGQLFMVAAYSNKDEDHVKFIEDLIKKQNIGGLIFFQGGPVRQSKQLARYQRASNIPLMIAMDAEWGLGMRLDSSVSYPQQLMLGAIRNDSLIYRMGSQIAEQSKLLGIHIDFAPVVDVNVNPQNPVIGSRSFGEDRFNVARKGIAYMKGLQSKGVAAVAKHFPGHGDTETDSHKTLPVVPHDINRLEKIELFPFKALIDSGVVGVMNAHLFIPELDSTQNRASTLSPDIVTGLLKKKLGFQGLSFTDALNMKGVSNFYSSGELELLALKAGNDVLLFPEDVEKAMQTIKEAAKEDDELRKSIESRCRKILTFKHLYGIDKQEVTSTDKLVSRLNDPSYYALRRTLIEQAITLVSDTKKSLPFTNVHSTKRGFVAIGASGEVEFHKQVSWYQDVSTFTMQQNSSEAELNYLIDSLNKLDEVIVTVHGTSSNPKTGFGVNLREWELIKKLVRQTSAGLVLFGSPYLLNEIDSTVNPRFIVTAYNDWPETQAAVAQLLYGGLGFKGSLPVSAGGFTHGAGLTTKAIRLSFGIPEQEGLNSDVLAQIDSIALKGIRHKAYPGCQILVARKGRVVFEKSYGHHTYEARKEVGGNDLYDLASITKIAATLPALMKLDDDGLIDLGNTLETFLPELVDTTEFATLTLREILAHQAGLRSWIPFYLKTMSDGVPRYDIYSLIPSDLYSLRVAEDLYINKNYQDTMLKSIVSTPLKNKGEYLYSDLGYYLIQRIIENTTNLPLEYYVRDQFYRPLGLRSMTFLPLDYFKREAIIPTENDRYFRKQLIWGDVHDPGAAMMGGVGGHAGLFSNSRDLAVLMQMYLNGGKYGGRDYLSDEIIKEYTKCQFCADSLSENRRGAGFDKPVRDGEGGPTCECVPLASFGHTGFTGTISWADPENGIVYIFLSNRIHPRADNKKLVEMNIRTDIMKTIYESVEKPESELMANRDH